MAHDVFISHALRDRGFVVAICKSLESAQVKCWITERDISAGEDWTEATRNAIASSRLMVLVLSENANAAPHLEREIAHAFYTKRPIFPVRITDTQPKRDFLFYLGNVHWVDAFNSSPEQYLQELTGRIRRILRSPIISRSRLLDGYIGRVPLWILGNLETNCHGRISSGSYRAIVVLLFASETGAVSARE
jgi:hypothetical protein